MVNESLGLAEQGVNNPNMNKNMSKKVCPPSEMECAKERQKVFETLQIVCGPPVKEIVAGSSRALNVSAVPFHPRDHLAEPTVVSSSVGCQSAFKVNECPVAPIVEQNQSVDAERGMCDGLQRESSPADVLANVFSQSTSEGTFVGFEDTPSPIEGAVGGELVDSELTEPLFSEKEEPQSSNSRTSTEVGSVLDDGNVSTCSSEQGSSQSQCGSTIESLDSTVAEMIGSLAKKPLQPPLHIDSDSSDSEDEMGQDLALVQDELEVVRKDEGRIAVVKVSEEQKAAADVIFPLNLQGKELRDACVQFISQITGLSNEEEMQMALQSVEPSVVLTRSAYPAGMVFQLTLSVGEGLGDDHKSEEEEKVLEKDKVDLCVQEDSESLDRMLGNQDALECKDVLSCGTNRSGFIGKRKSKDGFRVATCMQRTPDESLGRNCDDRNCFAQGKDLYLTLAKQFPKKKPPPQPPP